MYKSMRLTDWDEAQDLAQKWTKGNTQAKDEVVPPEQPKPKDKVSLEQAWEKFLTQRRTRKLRPATMYKYELLRRQMRAFANRKSLQLLEQFSLDVLDEFLAEWREGALASSKKLERLKAFFRFAYLRRWMDENPAEGLQGPRVDQRPTMPFTQEEMATILAAAEAYPDKSGNTGGPNALRLRAFILLLRYSGLRIGDAAMLRCERVAGNKLFLYTQKTGVPVWSVLPDFVVEALEAAPRLSDQYFFWTGRSTVHTAVGIWQRTLQNLFERAGIAKGYAHRFRDTFAVELLLSGVPTEEVSVLLGHSSIRITQKHYSPWVRARQQQLEAHLERAWNRDPLVLLQTPPSAEQTKLLPN